MRHCPAFLIGLLLPLVSGVAMADVYKWKDANGSVHYSDVPIDGAVLVKTSSRYGAVGSQASIPPYARTQTPPPSPERANEAIATANATKEVREEVAKTRTDQCKKAMESYEKSISARRLYRIGKSGEREYFSEAELEQARVAGKLERDAACGALAKKN